MFWGAIAGSVLGAIASSMIQGGASYASAQQVGNDNMKMFREGNVFNEHMFDRQQEVNQRMFDQANAYNDKSWDRAAAWNSAMTAQQNLENRYLANQAIMENRRTLDQGYSEAAASQARQFAFNKAAQDAAMSFNKAAQDTAMSENRYLTNQAIAENRRNQELAFAENRSSAQKAMDFEERMSSSAYQRAMADMAKAGLNPILAYAKAGASTPNAPALSAPTMSAPAMSAPMTSAPMTSGGSYGPALLAAPSGGAAGATLHGPTASGIGAGLGHSQGAIPAVAELGPAISSALQAYKTVAEIKLLDSEERVRSRQATDAEKFGDSALGRGVATVTRTLNTGWDRVQELIEKLRESNFRQPANGPTGVEPAIGVRFLGQGAR